MSTNNEQNNEMSGMNEMMEEIEKTMVRLHSEFGFNNILQRSLELGVAFKPKTICKSYNRRFTHIGVRSQFRGCHKRCLVIVFNDKLSDSLLSFAKFWKFTLDTND